MKIMKIMTTILLLVGILGMQQQQYINQYDCDSVIRNYDDNYEKLNNQLESYKEMRTLNGFDITGIANIINGLNQQIDILNQTHDNCLNHMIEKKIADDKRKKIADDKREQEIREMQKIEEEEKTRKYFEQENKNNIKNNNNIHNNDIYNNQNYNNIHYNNQNIGNNQNNQRNNVPHIPNVQDQRNLIQIEKIRMAEILEDSPYMKQIMIATYQNIQVPVGYERIIAEGDGNCLFRSISLALYGHQDNHAALRRAAHTHIQNNMYDYENVLDIEGNAKRVEFFNGLTLDWKKTVFMEDLETLRRPAGTQAVRALAEIYDIQINIHNTTANYPIAYNVNVHKKQIWIEYIPGHYNYLHQI